MSLHATRRGLRTLEAHAWQDMSACQDAALRRLTDAELETLCAVMAAHRKQIDAIPLSTIQDMPQPAWATSEEWAVLQRYARLFWAYWGKGAPHEQHL